VRYMYRDEVPDFAAPTRKNSGILLVSLYI
jgi:hypothetical protein